MILILTIFRLRVYLRIRIYQYKPWTQSMDSIWLLTYLFQLSAFSLHSIALKVDFFHDATFFPLSLNLSYFILAKHPWLGPLRLALPRIWPPGLGPPDLAPRAWTHLLGPFGHFPKYPWLLQGRHKLKVQAKKSCQKVSSSLSLSLLTTHFLEPD